MHDGKKPPRIQQLAIDQEVQALFDAGYQIVGLNLPCGYGKSYLARGWQRKWGYTDIITANNNLLKQYKRDYPELNLVMGKTHYDTAKEYNAARSLARTSAHSVFNPLSALFTVPREERQTKHIIVDEAHALGEMLRSSASYTFNTSAAGIPKWVTSEYHLVRWVQQRFQELTEALQRQDTPQLSREYEKVAALYYSIVGHEQDSMFKLTRSRTVVRGRRVDTMTVDVVDYPIGLIRKVLDAERVVLMSGTMTKYETEKLAAGRKWAWLSRPYLGDPENRKVVVRCFDREDRKDIPKVCAEIRRIYEETKEPMLVHITYGEIDEYCSALSGLPLLTNRSNNKDTIQERFCRSGGIWLAAGCAEGIDLPDGSCRRVVVPRLHFPNKGDIYTQKRLGQPDGRKWYGIKTVETLIQQLGRGYRHSEDYCTGYVFDPLFPSLWEEYGSEFEELNIVWGT